MFNNFSDREKYLALGTVSVVSAAIVYALIINPIAAKWKDLNNQIRAKTTMLERDSKLAANQKAIEAEYARFSKPSKGAKSIDQETADALAFIESVSKNDACFIVNIKPVDVEDTAARKEIFIDVTVEGNIAQLSKFLYDVENPREKAL